MAQDGTTAGGASYTIDNVTFPVGRTKLQSIFNAIRTNNKGASAPDLVAGQFWIDDSTDPTWTLYLYDGTDSIQFATINTTANTVNFIDSTFTQLTSDLSTNGNDINFGDSSVANFGDDNDFTIRHSGINLTLDNDTGSIFIRQFSDDGNIIIQNDDGAGGLANYIVVDGNQELTYFSKDTRHQDNVKAKFGSGSDLQIYHDGSNSYIEDIGTGDLFIKGQANITLQAYTTGETYANFNSNGSVDLYYDNNLKLATTSTGIDVTGTVNIENSSGYGKIELGGPSGAYIDMKTPFSDDYDARIICNGTDLTLQGASGVPVKLGYGTPIKLETTSTGVTVTGVLESDAPTRHSIRPSLNLDFANSKTLDPRITFTRASSGVYYDGYSSVKAEENLFYYSQEFDNAYWDKVRVDLTANDTTAPDGTTTAEKLAQASGETIGGAVYKLGFSLVNGSYYTLSIFAKAGTNRNFVGLRENVSGGNNTTWFNLSTGAVGTTDANHTATITDAGNGWYRCSITFLSGTTSGNLTYYVYETDGSTTVTDNQGFIYVWGGQVEERDTATAYTPTTSSPIIKYQSQLQTAQSNVARFDHNPTTGESLGLLIEESRTNLNTFSTPTSVNNGTTFTNSAIAPDGTLTASEIKDNGTAIIYGNSSVVSLTAGNSYTFSYYAKLGSYTGNVGILLYLNAFGNNLDAYFDLTTGTVSGTPSAGLDGYGITDVGNGWYRIYVTATCTTTDARQHQMIRVDAIQANKTFYVWGFQVEQGSFPTSYIKTTGSQVTRSADDAVMTGTNFTDWFNNQEGTLYVNCNINTLSEDNVGAVSLGDSANRIELRGTGSSTNTPRFDSIYNGTAQMAIQIPSLGSETNRRLALSYNMNDYNISTSANGNSVNKDISGNIPIIDSNDGLKIGKNAYTSSLQQLGGTIKKVSYYPIALTDTEIVDLTEA